MEYKLQLKTKEWKFKRLQILRRDKFKCKKCDSKNNLHVHHKVYVKGLMAWEAENKNLITLCVLCHELEHAKKHISTFFKNRTTPKKKTKEQKNKDRIKREMAKARKEQFKYKNFG